MCAVALVYGDKLADFSVLDTSHTWYIDYTTVNGRGAWNAIVDVANR
jgi:hypothetical protein